MRSNGLTARAYTPVADLDPVLADAMLDDLRRQGVAAYTKPVESTTAAGFDRPEFRTQVNDRLFVDAIESTRVRDLLQLRHPGMFDEANEDLAWAQIVAGFDVPVAAETNPWPTDEDVDGPPDQPSLFQPRPTDPDERAKHWNDDVSLPFTDKRRWSGRLDKNRDEADGEVDDADVDSSGSFGSVEFLESTSKTRGRERDDADEDRFVPEPPPPLPKLAPYKLISWIGVIGGPLLLLVCVLFNIQLQPWMSFVAVVGFIGGFITLVATMTDHDDEWDPGNGAVV